MSLLQINKKVITEEDGQLLIDQTCSMRAPLGTPTEFIRPEEFDRCSVKPKNPYLSLLTSCFSTLRMEWKAIKKTSSFLSQGGYGREHSRSEELSVGVSGEIISKVVDPRKKYLADSSSIFEEGFEKKAHYYSPDVYKQPKSSLIKMFPNNASCKDMMGHALKASFMKRSFPGFDAQVQLFVLWHEIAHGAGAGEPQADAIAAVVNRQAFEDHNVLRVWSDYRALSTILDCSHPNKAEVIEGLGKYGWPTVEAVDYIGGLPQATIDQMSEGDIKNIRFQKFDHMTESVLDIGGRLRRKAGEEAFKARDFEALERTALELCDDEDFGVKEQQILKRFALACRRFSVGEGAYTNEEELVTEELLGSEGAEPLSFTPGEHIPD